MHMIMYDYEKSYIVSMTYFIWVIQYQNKKSTTFIAILIKTR